MAKVSFTKLGLTKNQDVEIIDWNGQNIEVKQYLPVQDKLILITNIINNAHDEKNYSNPVKVDIFTALEILYFYTNINFTDKQKEDPTKLFDLVVSSGLFDAVKCKMDVTEYNQLINAINKSIKAIYDYQNSILGILDTIKEDYSNLNFNATEIQSKLADPENMEFLKGILSKLG